MDINWLSHSEPIKAIVATYYIGPTVHPWPDGSVRSLPGRLSCLALQAEEKTDCSFISRSASFFPQHPFSCDSLIMAKNCVCPIICLLIKDNAKRLLSRKVWVDSCMIMSVLKRSSLLQLHKEFLAIIHTQVLLHCSFIVACCVNAPLMCEDIKKNQEWKYSSFIQICAFPKHFL